MALNLDIQYTIAPGDDYKGEKVVAVAFIDKEKAVKAARMVCVRVVLGSVLDPICWPCMCMACCMPVQAQR